MKSIIVPTDVAVAFLVREGASKAQARRWIYSRSMAGRLTNHGKTGNGQARWDLAEIDALIRK
ncbi:hypothetical protein [Streptomyces cinereoruber]|uniref:hypothetical protein n=1 Tax=Streptomyces cinereoruber TaxID=67260 RepID=UPI00363BDBB4